MSSGIVNKNNNKQIGNILCTLCFVTNIGQMPIFLNMISTRNIIIPMWIIFLAFCLFQNHILYIGNSTLLLLMGVFFFAYYFLGSFLITGYKASELPYSIFLSFFIFIAGLIAGPLIKKDDIEKIYTAYVISGLLVGINVFVSYIFGSSLSSRTYAYASKNSVSQILLTAWILILIYEFTKDNGIITRFFYIGSFGFLLYTLIGLRSRATLISIPIVFIIILANGKVTLRLRRALIVLLVFVTLFLILNQGFTENFITNVIYGGRNANDINDISSGRWDEWIAFPSQFVDKPLFGHGRMKRESLLLTALLEFGLIGGLDIIFIAFYPVWWAFRTWIHKDRHFLIFITIGISYFVNGIFEQLAPFGPGVKCYFLWFLLGLYVPMSLREREQKK